MIPQTLLLIDGHNTLLRSFHAFEELEASDGRRLGGLYGFLQSLIRLMGLHRKAVPIVCFDGGRSVRRLR
jgi:5'-3' exonuclease